MAKLYLGTTQVTPIVEVPVATKKYGATIDNLLGDVSADGVYSLPAPFELDASAVKSLPAQGWRYKFYNTAVQGQVVLGFGPHLSGANCASACFMNCTGITSVDLSSLVSVDGSYCMQECFSGCTGITSVDLSSLTTVGGTGTLVYGAMGRCFYGCTNLAAIDLSSLVEVRASSSLADCFNGCTKLASVNVDSLRRVFGNTAMQTCFQNCKALTTISFPSLNEIAPASTQNQFQNMFQGCTALAEIHFPVNMQTRIEQMTGYATNFGATNATILFDLPSTEDA